MLKRPTIPNTMGERPEPAPHRSENINGQETWEDAQLH